MGVLLTFMFVLNMLGALILIPALACLLIQQPPQGEFEQECHEPEGSEHKQVDSYSQGLDQSEPVRSGTKTATGENVDAV